MFSNYHEQLKMSKGHMPTYNLQLGQSSGSSLKKHQILKNTSVILMPNWMRTPMKLKIVYV